MDFGYRFVGTCIMGYRRFRRPLPLGDRRSAIGPRHSLVGVHDTRTEQPKCDRRSSLAARHSSLEILKSRYAYLTYFTYLLYLTYLPERIFHEIARVGALRRRETSNRAAVGDRRSELSDRLSSLVARRSSLVARGLWLVAFPFALALALAPACRSLLVCSSVWSRSHDARKRSAD